MTLERFLGSLDNYLVGNLWFTGLDTMNDPMEGIPEEVWKDAAVEEAMRNDLQTRLADCKICCLSEEFDNFAMWSHYAAAHTGVCLQFSIDPEVLKRQGIEYTQISYADGIPFEGTYKPLLGAIKTIEDSKGIAQPESTESMRWNLTKEILSHKFSDWGYEKEWRLLLSKGDAGFRKIGELTKIIFGWKCKLLSEHIILAHGSVMESLRDIMVVGLNKEGKTTLVLKNKPKNKPKGTTGFEGGTLDHNKPKPSTPNSAVDFFNRGNMYYGKGRIDQAIDNYTAALKIKPDYLAALNNRGNAYDDKGEYDKAIVDYTAALAVKPDFPEALYNRGNAYAGKGEYEAAIEDYTAVLKIKKDDHKALNNRGAAYYNKGEYDAAIADYAAALAIKPDDHQALYNRGNAHYKKGEYDAAIADYSAALAVKPDDHEVLCNRGAAYADKGDYGAAIADYTAALAIKPDFTEAQENLAKALAAKDAQDAEGQE
jgi:tetratricopeptide (TPR) repeat protein